MMRNPRRITQGAVPSGNDRWSNRQGIIQLCTGDPTSSFGSFHSRDSSDFLFTESSYIHQSTFMYKELNHSQKRLGALQQENQMMPKQIY